VADEVHVAAAPELLVVVLELEVVALELDVAALEAVSVSVVLVFGAAAEFLLGSVAVEVVRL
jgi:hypothetical protein